VRGKRRDNATRLRNAVEALPRHTKEGMLRGIRRNRIIFGAYVDKRGGVCPMLAAHRNGGRTNFGTFARAWDAYTGAKKPRRATTREVRTLTGYLEVALIRDGIAPPEAPEVSWGDRSLADEVRDVQASRRRLAEAEASEGVTIEELMSEEPIGDGPLEEIAEEPIPAAGPAEAAPTEPDPAPISG
jgi:hypothetical protein